MGMGWMGWSVFNKSGGNFRAEGVWGGVSNPAHPSNACAKDYPQLTYPLSWCSLVQWNGPAVPLEHPEPANVRCSL
jgi:hypothetical protein